jgi:hypothetical protein
VSTSLKSFEFLCANGDAVATLKAQNSMAHEIAGGTSGSAERSTQFSFQNKIFGLDGGYFSMTRDSQEPVFHVMLGELRVALPLPTLRAEFKIPADSPDGKLLEIVEKSLRFVKEICPNDEIPRELLDGSASWAVEERHRLIAQSRLAMQVCTWMSEEETVISDLDQLQQLADDPVTKQRVQSAVGEIAERLGVGRDRKRLVMDKIDRFARELAYIEALRERGVCVKRVIAMLNKLMKIYRADKSVVEDIVRVLQLLRPPAADFDTSFELIDAQTGQILGILQKFNAQVQFVREMRNDLHQRLMMWDELHAKWDGLSAARSPEAEALIRESYRFAAYHFPQARSWQR